MKNKILIAVAILVGIVFISMIFSGEAHDSFKQGMDASKNTVEQLEK